jgi:hypothetical protein
MRESPRRRSGALLIAAIAIVMIALVWWLARDRDAPKTVAQGGDRDQAAGAREPQFGGVSPRAAQGAAPFDLADERARPSVPPPQPEKAFPYPPGSQPLTEGVDPAAGVGEESTVDAETGLRVVFGARRDVVHPPDPIVVDLQVLSAKNKRVDIGAPYARFRSERMPPSGPGFDAPFTDDGRGADRASGDLAYTATYRPSATEQAALLGFRVFIEVGFEAPNGLGPRKYVTSVQYTLKPNAELTGQYSDALQGGSLVVSCGVQVNEAGQYKVIASLYAGDGETAIAFAQNSQPLSTGEQQLPLTFFGKILHDRGVDGPYVMRYVMLFQEFPNQGTYWPGVTVDHAYTTRPYRAKDFSPESFTPPPPSFPIVNAESPSQQGKPPALFDSTRRLPTPPPGAAPPAPPPSSGAPSSSAPSPSAPGALPPPSPGR